jgi:hypothetical protein
MELYENETFSYFIVDLNSLTGFASGFSVMVASVFNILSMRSMDASPFSTL